MAAQSAAASDQILLSASKTLRDYHLSLALLVAGVVVVVAFYGFVFWADGTGNYPTSIATDSAISAIGSIGFTLILVGAIFTGINWSFLRKSDRIPLSTSKTRRDYRLSLALLVAGIVMVVAFSVVALWVSAIGNYPSTVTTVVIATILSIGSILIAVCAIFTVINWSLLRKSRRNA